MLKPDNFNKTYYTKFSIKSFYTVPNCVPCIVQICTVYRHNKCSKFYGDIYAYKNAFKNTCNDKL